MIKRFVQTGLMVATLALSACASGGRDGQTAGNDIYDPLEPFNRGIFAFNEGVDYILLDPLTEVYRFVVPDAFRAAIANVLNNLKSPVYLANELLQGDWDGAAVVTQRFVFNTFTGFGGILDTAAWEGITHTPEDFGQTLATWGFGPGPYLVLPLLGPSNARDAVGLAGDMGMDPINWYVWNTDSDDIAMVRTGATILTVKDQTLDIQRDLKRNSLDYYAATRSVWMQRRQALINDTGDGSYVEYE